MRVHQNGYLKLYELITTHEPELMATHLLARFKRELNTLVFQFMVRTETQQWILRRTLADFLDLHRQLRHLLERRGVKLQVIEDNRKEAMDTLEDYLHRVSQMPEVVRTEAWQLFMEISDVPQRWQGHKFRETYLKKRAGGRYNEKCCNCGILFGSEKRRYFVINSEGVYYFQDHLRASTKIKDMLAFNYQFAIRYNHSPDHFLEVKLVSSHRELEVKCYSLLQYVDLILTVKEAMNSNSYLKANRFGSFAPLRSNSYCKFLVDGQDYFRELSQDLAQAQKHIYITGWWLSPEFYLTRPASYAQDRPDRLDLTLKAAAERGVKVCIIVYLEPKIAINNDSIYTKQSLEKLHPSIRVLRHPNFLVVPLLWSHHEKMVIIDQKLAYMGGLDICYGRMDSSAHRLVDLGPETMFPGIDYVNFRTKDITNPRAFTKESIDRRTTPRMPWHDVGIKLRGGSATDLTRHFVQYWNFVNLQTTNSKEIMDTLKEDQANLDPYQNYLDNIKRRDKREELSSFNRDERERADFLEMTAGSEPPVSPSSVAPGDMEGDFIEMLSGLRQPEPLLPLQMPSSLPPEPPEETVRTRNNTLFNLPNRLLGKMKSLIHNNESERENIENLAVESGIEKRQGTCETQILRSASSWSVGLKPNFHEMSIHIAYIELIAKAKEFIYIENQFFISSTAGDPVKNHIAEAIVMKIKKAAKNKQPFKVIVMLPLLPGFEGEIDDDSSGVFRIQLHWEYQTICRGGTSIYEQLRDIPNAKEYISFYGLRTHAVLNDRPVTEIVYIHTKLMIIDDEYVIIGSANINDRSLLGERDSEVAVVVKDERVVRGPRGTLWRQCAHDLRVTLMAEHFGFQREEVEDYFDPALSDKITVRTVYNS